MSMGPGIGLAGFGLGNHREVAPASTRSLHYDAEKLNGPFILGWRLIMLFSSPTIHEATFLMSPT